MADTNVSQDKDSSMANEVFADLLAESFGEGRLQGRVVTAKFWRSKTILC